MSSFFKNCELNIKKWMTSFVLGRSPLTFSSISRRNLSAYSQQLIEQAFLNIQVDKLIDYHAHLIGTQTAITGNFIHTHFLSWKHPLLHLAALAFQAAFGINSIEHADPEALAQLINLINYMPAHGKYCLFALDSHYDENGFFDLIKSKIHVSNAYIVQAARSRPELFIPVISIHPYRADAVDELEKWAQQGVKMVKWLPNTMGINPTDPRCDKFYKKMHALKLILLTHTGHESAIPGAGQKLGNPLLLRRALDQQVKVIMAHCATLGKGIDEEHNERKTDNFDLFLGLMDISHYKNHLFGDLSAVTQINRAKYLPQIIALSQPGELLSNRLVNGSDYPLPVFHFLISTRQLKMKGLITEEERKGLNEIYHWNPLLFDFILKRTLKHPENQQKLPAEIFMMNAHLNLLTI